MNKQTKPVPTDGKTEEPQVEVPKKEEKLDKVAEAQKLIVEEQQKNVAAGIEEIQAILKKRKIKIVTTVSEAKVIPDTK